VYTKLRGSGKDAPGKNMDQMELFRFLFPATTARFCVQKGCPFNPKKMVEIEQKVSEQRDTGVSLQKFICLARLI
jgi:hypothetical protein